MNKSFWQALEQLLADTRIVIDRPAGQPHPRYPEIIYPLDYGYLEGTTAGDGACIDVWAGSLDRRTLSGVLCTYDEHKKDAEIKLLAGCSQQDIHDIQVFHESLTSLHMIFISNPKEVQ